MDGLFGPNKLMGLSATETLFTDEKTANARGKVIEWLNTLGTAEPATKCSLLVKIQETILGSCVELLEEFVESILSLSHDPNMEVRRQTVAFMEQTCKVKVEFLPQIINIISMLLRDRSPQVIKRVIQACGSIYKNGLQWICGHAELTESVEQSWNILSLVKAQILDLIDNDNDGIRTNAIKFLEGVVILQTGADEDSQKRENDFSLEDVPEHLKILKRAKLEEEALRIFDILLKFHAATHISSVNLIACTSSLCTIAKMRPSMMGLVVEAFKHLNMNLPPTLTDSQVSSVRKSLKMQLMALLKNRGSYEYQATIRHMLLDLGTSQGEIQRSIPKMDKQEQMRRQKRILENAANNINKRIRLNEVMESDGGGASKASSAAPAPPLRMEIDEDELNKQRQKSTRVNEKFIAEHLRAPAMAVNLVLAFLPQLPDEAPPHFLANYTPIRDMTRPQQVAFIAKLLGEQMTGQKIGPGAAAFSKEPPMRPAREQPEADEAMEVDEPATGSGAGGVPALQAPLDEEQLRKEEATKKLRENMERLKGEQELIERMKQRVKTLKLQEITKPFNRPIKEKFLMDAVKRILNAERHCILGGVAAKRRKIVTVIAATFPDSVRYFIFDFIMQDVRQRIDLAFSWLYEEYSLLQGFTRHSYVKSENRPDFAYNELLSQLIKGVRERCELKDKIILLRRLFLEAPLLPDEANSQLVELCLEQDELSPHCLDLMRDLVVWRPPRKQKFLRLLLTFSLHERADLRERAMEHLITIYNVHKILPQRIDECSIQWAMHLEKELPPASIFGSDYGRPEVETAWKEETAKTCLGLLLNMLPYNPTVYLERLCHVYSVTSADLKRTILRSIDPAIKKLGADNPTLLKLIEDCPKGTETLVIRIVYILTERVATPNAELLKRVRDLHANKVRDVRVLIPVLSGLSRKEILSALPKLLKLNQVVVKEVFNRLLGVGAEFANQTMATTPTDIMVALHTLNLNECDLKAVVKATSLCLAEKEVFTQDILISVLKQLAEVVPIPTLLMRTIIQSLTLYPSMSNFVLNLLQRLIVKQVWRQKVIWDGFLKCVQRLKPQSMAVMLQLPLQQLSSALKQCPDLRESLLEHARSVREEPMSGVTPKLMEILEGKLLPDVFVTDDSGGYMVLDTPIKKEIEDPSDAPMAGVNVSVLTSLTPAVPAPVVAVPPKPVKVLDPGQPLPPGED